VLSGIETAHKVCEQNGLVICDESWTRLEEYVSLLLEWNSRINLISRKDVDNIWISHILHSLSPLVAFEFRAGWKILDIGSGGGLPGIPIAIARPDLNLHLIDSIGKKTMATSEMIRQIGITNVSVLTGRVEELGNRDGFKNRFDGVLARGVAPLVELLRWSRPILKCGLSSGRFELNCHLIPPFVLAMKGGDLTAELVDAGEASNNKPNIQIKDLELVGSENFGLEGKKFVIVNF